MIQAGPSVIYANDEVRALAAELPALATALRWAEEYLSAPHPDLGRPGLVCPYVRAALRTNTIWFTEVHTERADAEVLDARLIELAGSFADLDPVQEALATGKALLITFPDVRAEDAKELLGGMLRRVKPAFVDAGLMLGPVFPDNEIPGAHNPAFRPMRGPVPLVAIRVLVETDLPFLDRPIDPPHLRARYLRSYLDRLGTQISTTRKEKAERALAAATSEVNPR
jgi:Domain of unknown function (DUF6875)